MFYVWMLVSAVVSYVSGSVNGAIITSKNFYKKDIRQYGSGNPGLTNFYRVFGKVGVLMVLIIDIFKTAAPVVLSGILFGGLYDRALFGSVFAGLLVLIGHAFPVFYGFSGGKTVMATGVILFFVDWKVALVGWGIFLIVVLLTKYVSLGAILGGISYPITIALFEVSGPVEVCLAALCALLLVVRHSGNIKRIIQGKESKFSFRRSKEGKQ